MDHNGICEISPKCDSDQGDSEAKNEFFADPEDVDISDHENEDMDVDSDMKVDCDTKLESDTKLAAEMDTSPDLGVENKPEKPKR